MPSHVAMEDPIVSPGMPAAHEHEFFGNTTTGAFSTYESMIVAPTTCSAAEDTAGYWTPTLFAADGTRVPAADLLSRQREHRAVPAGSSHDLRRRLGRRSGSLERDRPLP